MALTGAGTSLGEDSGEIAIGAIVNEEAVVLGAVSMFAFFPSGDCRPTNSGVAWTDLLRI